MDLAPDCSHGSGPTWTFASSPAVSISERKGQPVGTQKEILDYLLQNCIHSSGSRETDHRRPFCNREIGEQEKEKKDEGNEQRHINSHLF